MDLRVLAVSARREGKELSGGAVHQRRFRHARRAASRAQNDGDDAGELRLAKSSAPALSRFQRPLRRRAAERAGQQSGGVAVVSEVAVALTAAEVGGAPLTCASSSSSPSRLSTSRLREPS